MSKKTIFVAFGHRKRVGKNTAARFLCSYLRMNKRGSNIQSHGYADKGKDICHELYSWAGLQSRQHYEEHPEEREVVLPLIGKSPRQIWIDFMSHAVRNEVYDLTWVMFLKHNIKCDVCIVRDMRFPIEGDIIHQDGGLVIRIDREDAPNDSDYADDAMIGYTKWDEILVNNGTLSEFNRKIELIGERILSQL